MGRKVDVDNLVDAHEVAAILGLSHYQTVHTYLRRYPDMPRPVIDKPTARLWLRTEVERWAKQHQAAL